MFLKVSFSLFNLVAVSSNSSKACCSLGAPSKVLPTKNENGVGNKFRLKSCASFSGFPFNRFDNLITSFMCVSTSVANASTSSSPDGLSSSHVTSATRYGFVRTILVTRNRSCPLQMRKNRSSTRRSCLTISPTQPTSAVPETASE